LGRRRLSPCIASRIWGRVSLNVSSIGCIVGDIASGISRGVCWSISRWVGWSIGCSVSSGVTQLHHFHLFLLHPPGRGDPGYDVAGKDAPICFWNKNLPQIYCIWGLFPRSEQLQHGRWLGGTGSLENLQGGLGQRERLPNWSAVSCKLHFRHARSP
jgi:hypothetical protein